MKLEEKKQLLLIGGVIAGCTIILVTRLLFGKGFETNTSPNNTSLMGALETAKVQATDTYTKIKKETAENPSLTALKAHVEAAVSFQQKNKTQTIEALGEKLKTAHTESLPKP